MKPERVIRYNAALEQTKGDRHAAAQILGVTEPSVKAAIAAAPELARWLVNEKASSGTERAAPTAVEVMSRPQEDRLPEAPPVEAEVMSDLAIARMIEKEDKEFARGLGALKLRPAEMDVVASVAKFYGRFYVKAQDSLLGQCTLTGIKLTAEIAKLMDEPEGHPDDEDEEGECVGEMLAAKYASIVGLVNALNNLTNTVVRANSAKSIIALKKAQLETQRNNPQKRNNKPGFQPLLAANNAQINNYYGKEQPPTNGNEAPHEGADGSLDAGDEQPAD